MTRVTTAFTFLASLVSVALVAYSAPFGALCLAGMAAAAGVLARKKPEWTLQFLLFLIPFTGLLNMSLKVRGIPAMIAVVYAVLFGAEIGRDAGAAPRFRYRLPVKVFIAAAFFSAAVAVVKVWSIPHRPLANSLAWVTVELLMALLGPLSYRVWAQSRLTDRTMFAPFLLPFYIGLFQFLGWTRFGVDPLFVDNGLPQYGATFTDPNALGVVCALMLTPAFARVIERPRIPMIYCVAVSLLSLIFISGSRSAVLVALIGLFVFSAFTISRRPRLLAVSLISAAFLIAAVTIYGAFSKKEMRLFATGGQVVKVLKGELPVADLAGGRRVMWRGALAVFKRNPVTGVGMGAYMIHLPQYRRELGELVNDNAGSQYFQIMAEQGLVGLAVFLFLVGSVMREFLQCARKTALQTAAFASVAGLMVAFFFGAHVKNLEVNFIFWGLLSLLAEPSAPGLNEHT